MPYFPNLIILSLMNDLENFMRKKLLVFLTLFTVYLSSYEWNNFLNYQSNTFDLYKSANNSNIYFSTFEGLRVFQNNENCLYPYGNLSALGVAENCDQSYIIFGSGSYSDGLYTFNENGNFTLVDWQIFPRFLDKGRYTQNIYFSSSNSFQINRNLQWTRPAEFYYKDVNDITESPSFQFAATTRGFYRKEPGESALFANRQNFGTLQSNEINEASGIVASRMNPGVLWTHNDSGGGNFLFALNELGQHLGIYTVVGTNNRDWEDIAIGKNPTNGQSEIYLADIGDNQLVNEVKYIYIATEPQVSPNQSPLAVDISSTQALSFIYPNNVKYDAETLLYDERSQKFFIITKRHPGNPAASDKIFSLDYVISDCPQIATYEGEVNIPVDEIVNQGSTGGDISPDGNFILIKNYQNVYLWERRDMSIANALNQEFIEVPYIMEPQGEAIAWRYDNNGYFTVSEEHSNVPAVLYFYSKLGWRKTSPLPFKKSEYDPFNGKLYSIINQEPENNGLWMSNDSGENWQRIDSNPSYSDIAVDNHGTIFLSHFPSLIPEDWQRITAFKNSNFYDLSSGLENITINRLVNNTILDYPSVFICSNAGVFYLEDYLEVSINDEHNTVMVSDIVAYPNPFREVVYLSNPSKNIISAKVFNLKGQLIEELNVKNKGTESLLWKANNSIPNGIYIIKINTPEKTSVHKVLKIN